MTASGQCQHPPAGFAYSTLPLAAADHQQKVYYYVVQKATWDDRNFGRVEYAKLACYMWDVRFFAMEITYVLNDLKAKISRFLELCTVGCSHDQLIQTVANSKKVVPNGRTHMHHCRHAQT